MAYTDPVRMLSDISEGFKDIATNIAKIRMPKKSTAFKQLHTEVLALTKQNHAFSDQMKVLGKEFRELEKRVSKYEVELEDLREAQIRYTNSTTKSTAEGKKQAKLFKFLGKSAAYLQQQLQWYPAKTVTFTILNSLRAIPKLTADYGQALSKVSSIARMSSASLDILDKKIKEVSNTTKFYLTDVAEVTKQLAQAGFRDSELLSALDPVAKLAQATSSELSAAANLESTVIRAFKKDASEFVQVSDVIANAVVNTRLSLEDLNTAFSYVGSAAAQTGVSLEETVTLLGILRNSGLQASTAATGLRMALLQLTAPTRKGQKVLNQAGLSADDLNIADKGIKQVLKSVTELSKVQLINIFGARSANAILVFKNMSIDAINSLQDMIEVSGTTALMAQEQLYTLANTWDILINSLQISATNFGKLFEENVIVSIRASIQGVNDFNKVFKRLTGVANIVSKALIGFIGAISGLIIFKVISKSIKFLITTMLELKTVVLSLTGVLENAVFAFEAYALGAASLGEALYFLIGPLTIVTAGLALLAGGIWLSNAQDSEKVKLNIEKASVAMGKLVGDATQLAIKMEEISNLNLTEATKKAILKPMQDETVKQANDYFSRLKAQAKNNKYLIDALNKEEAYIVEQIKKATSAKQLNEIITNIGKHWTLTLEKTGTELRKLYEEHAKIDITSTNLDKIQEGLNFIESQLANTNNDVIKASTKTANEMFSALVNSQSFLQYKTQLNSFYEDLQKPNVAMIQAYEAEYQMAKKGLRVIQSLLTDYYNGKITLTEEQLNSYIDLNSELFNMMESYEGLKNLTFPLLQKDVEETGKRTASLMFQKYFDGYKKEVKNAKNAEEAAAISKKWQQKLHDDLKAQLESDEAKQGISLSAAEAKRIIKKTVDETATNFANAANNYSLTDQIAKRLKTAKTNLSSAKLNLNLTDQLVRYNEAYSQDAQVAFTNVLKKERDFILATYEAEVNSLGQEIADANKEARLRLLDIEGLKRNDQVANQFLANTNKQIQALKVLANYEESTGTKRITLDTSYIQILKEKRIELEELGNKSGDTILKLAKLDKLIKELGEDINETKLAPMTEELSSLNTQIEDMTSIRDFELDSGNFIEVYKLNKKIYALYEHQLEVLREQATKKHELGELDDKSYEAIMAKLGLLAKQYKKSYSPIGQVLKETQDLLSDSFSTFFKDAISGTKKLSDAFKDLGRSIVDSLSQAFADAVANMMVEWAIMAMASFMHTGGVVGKTATVKKPVDPLIFAGAPRLHNGLMADEFPAILQKGETVLPKDSTIVQTQQTAPNVEVNVINQVGDAEVEKSGPRYDGEKYVLDVLLKAKRKGNPQMKQILGTA